MVRFAKKLPRNPVNNRLIDQLVGAGTSIGANSCEADDSVSGKDFKNRIGTCRKESKETMFFLRIIAQAKKGWPRMKQSLREVGFGESNTVTDGVVIGEEAIDLLATYSGQAPFLKEWSRGAEINTDRNLRLQYLAGMWLNSNMGDRILSSILAYHRFPDRHSSARQRVSTPSSRP